VEQISLGRATAADVRKPTVKEARGEIDRFFAAADAKGRIPRRF